MFHMTQLFQKAHIARQFFKSRIFLAFSFLAVATVTSCQKADLGDRLTQEAADESFKLAQEKYFSLTREFVSQADYYNSLPPVQRDAAIRKYLARLDSLKEPMSMVPKVNAYCSDCYECMEDYLNCSPQTMIIGYAPPPSTIEVDPGSVVVDWRVLTHVFNWWQVDSYETLHNDDGDRVMDHNGSVLSGPASIIVTWTENYEAISYQFEGLTATVTLGGYVSCGGYNSATEYRSQTFIL